MGFHKAIAKRRRAGNKVGRSGFGAAKGHRARRWSGTMPTAYWRVEGIADDATALPDISKRGLGLDGVLGGTVNETAGNTKTWNTAQVPPGSNQSVHFDGSTNKVTVAYNAALKPDLDIDKLSVSIWFKTSETGDPVLFLVAETDEATPTAGWFYFGLGQTVANRGQVYWNTSGAAGWRSTTGAVNDDKWHHIVHVYDGNITNEIKIYLDGVLDQQYDDQSGNLVVNNVPILIGYRRHTNADYYQYYMDEIAYFTNIALTAKQVKDMYNNGTVVNSRAGILRS